jgi:hypothetical protein
LVKEIKGLGQRELLSLVHVAGLVAFGGISYTEAKRLYRTKTLKSPLFIEKRLQEGPQSVSNFHNKTRHWDILNATLRLASLPRHSLHILSLVNFREMASRDSSRTSTVLSKTTAKVILKKSKISTLLSAEDKKETLRRKVGAIDDFRRKRAESATLKQDTIGKLQNKVRNTAEVNVSQTPKLTKPPSLKTVWAVAQSNNEYRKLIRPEISASETSAINRLQTSSRSVLGSVSGNVLPQIAGSQGTFIANGDRPTDKIHKLIDFQVGVIFSTATHQRDFARELDPRNANQSMTRLGIVYSKFRKFIVVARFATHVLALYVLSFSNFAR